MECTVSWTGNSGTRSGMGFVAETGSGHVLTMDGAPDASKPENGGANLAARPMETVLAGTGGIGTDTEKHAYITQSGCGKQRVNQRMGCDITVRITFDAVTIPTQTGKP